MIVWSGLHLSVLSPPCDDVHQTTRHMPASELGNALAAATRLSIQKSSLLQLLLVMVAGLAAGSLCAQTLPPHSKDLPRDSRLGELRNLNGYFPFKPVSGPEDWQQRRAEIRRRILVSQGLWPLPTKSPLRAVIHGTVDRDQYSVDRVIFESIPGHFVTGSLYRPQGKPGPFPAILSPHGHWKEGRFYKAGTEEIERQLQTGAESFEHSGRYPIQARAVQLARMGCLVFVYDMTGTADSIQIEHRPAKWSHLDTRDDWGFMSVQADLRLQNMMGLQTWNSIRAIDFLLELEDTDPTRIGVTGASGGGTQSMVLTAIDERIAAAMPCVMVSTAMQGGCTCENAPYLRIDQGNIDIAAATAPRPLGLTAADDWTVELQSKGFPDLQNLYRMLGHEDRLFAVFHTQFPHNYNQVNRAAMYGFFNDHFQLGFTEPIIERDFSPLSREEATVWTSEHPAPSGDQIGPAHEIRLLKTATRDAERKIEQLIPDSKSDAALYRQIIGGGWETILGRRFDQVGDVSFIETDEGEIDSVGFVVGRLNHAKMGEQIPTILLGPTAGSSNSTANRPGTVIWITDTGKQAAFQSGEVIEPVRKLADAGYVVIAADLFGQGEMIPSGQTETSQRMWYQRGGDQGWHRFSGYTYGYNHPLFCQRVHDTLSLIQYASSSSAGPVHLIGIGSVAGPIVAAAQSQTTDQVAETFIDAKGFRFAGVERHDDAMMVPGAVKYLDLDGLLSLCAPSAVTLLNQAECDAAQRVYAAYRAEEKLVFRTTTDSVSAVVDELVGNPSQQLHGR